MSPCLLALWDHPWIASFVACVCVLGQVCPGVYRSQAWSEICGGSVAQVFIFLSVFRVCPTFAVMLLLFGAVCSVSLVLAQFGRTLVWTGQGYIFVTLQYIRWAPGWIKLKLEDLQKQVGKLAEEYGALVVDVTLRDGFNVPQVELVTGIKFLRVLKKEGFAPSFPEVLYFFVKKAKSIQKHLDKNRNVRDSKFRLILVENCIHRFARYCRRVKLLPASWKYVSATASIGTCGRSTQCDPNVSVRRIEPSFREGGGSSLSGIP